MRFCQGRIGGTIIPRLIMKSPGMNIEEMGRVAARLSAKPIPVRALFREKI